MNNRCRLQTGVYLRDDHLHLPSGPDSVEIRLISFVAFHLSQPSRNSSGLISPAMFLEMENKLLNYE